MQPENLVNGIPININVERLEKIVPPKAKKGENSSSERYIEKWKFVSNHILVSEQTPMEFSFVPKEPGKYNITAFIKDSKGREHRSSDH